MKEEQKNSGDSGPNLKYVTATELTSKRGKVKSERWLEFVSHFKEPIRAALTERDFDLLDDKEKLTWKSRGGWYILGQRDDDYSQTASRRRVIDRCAITIDIDKATKDIPDIIARQFAQYQYLMHQTFSSTEEQPRYRLIIPLQQALPLDQFAALSTLICQQIGMEYCDLKSSRSPHQLMFFPVVLRGRRLGLEVNEEANSVIMEGNFYLENVWQHVFPGAWDDISSWPDVKSGESFMRARKARSTGIGARQQNPTEKTNLIGDFCKIYPIKRAVEKFLSDIWEYEGDNRFTYVNGTSKKGGIAYADEGPNPDEDTWVFLYSHHGSDPYNDMQLNAFDLVRLHYFGDLDHKSKAPEGSENLPSYKAMMDFARKDDEVVTYRLKASKEGAPKADLSGFDEFEPVIKPEGSRTTPSEGKKDEGGSEKSEAESATGKQERDFERNDNNKIIKSLNNIAVAIRLSDLPLAYNTRKELLVQIRPCHINGIPYPVDDPVNGQAMSTNFLSGARRMMEDQPGGWVSLPLAEQSVTDVLEEISPQFDPVKSYLESLPPWDKKARIGKFWIRTAGAVDDPVGYCREVTENLLIAACSITYRPGHAYPLVPILHGPEGTGKSSMMRRLLPSDEMFSDSIVMSSGAQGNQRYVESISGAWICEIAELKDMMKNDSGVVKSFITTGKVLYRKPYARMPSVWSKRLVKYGTVNYIDFLSGDVGSRRWAPIETTGKGNLQKRADKNFLWVEKHRDQLWAEAFHKAKALDFALPTLSGKAEKHRVKMVERSGRVDSSNEITIATKALLEDKLETRTSVAEMRVELGYPYRLGPNQDFINKAISTGLRESGWSPSRKLNKSDSMAEITEKLWDARISSISLVGSMSWVAPLLKPIKGEF